MRIFLKIVFITSATLLCFWLLAGILENFIPLEFADNQIENRYDQLRFYGVPLAILLTLTGTIQPRYSRIRNAGTIVITTFFALLIFFFMFVSVLAGMCDTFNGNVLFEKKGNPSVKIIDREFGCGATDSSPPNHHVCMVWNITPYFIWVEKADTGRLDSNEWRRVANNEN